MSARIVVIGGYGNFGRRICEALAGDADLEVLVAGRDLAQATLLAQKLGARCSPLLLDVASPDLAVQLRACDATLAIHTAGPFQGQDYRVAEACIAAGCHYLDLADARAYVCGITTLDARAQAAGLLVVSGASSVPALAAAVIDRYRGQFAQLHSIRHAISSGAVPPGIATMRAVMGYVGQPFRRWREGRWQTVHGWQDLHMRRLPSPLGRRWLAACDVPDLELFPQRYAGVQEVSFHAGLGYATSTIATWALSWLVRSRLLPSLVPLSRPLHALAGWLAPWGSRHSAMHVEMRGQGQDGQPLQRDWYLVAGSDHGPRIPCLPAIALARRRARGQIARRGAMPCMGLLTPEEILGAIPGLDLHTEEN